jgi:hypothetical protein
MREMSSAYNILFEYHIGKLCSEEQTLDLRITLRLVLDKWGLNFWTGFSCHRIGLAGRLLRTQ